MTPFFATFTFINIWFISLFAVRPAMRGRLWWKIVLVNTLVAVLLTVGVHFLLKSGWIPLRHAY